MFEYHTECIRSRSIGEGVNAGGVGAVVEHDGASDGHLYEAARAGQQLLRGHDAVRLLPEQPHSPP